MGVKASIEGIKKMEKVINERELYTHEYHKLYTIILESDIDIGGRTIRKFVKGKEVHKG